MTRAGTKGRAASVFAMADAMARDAWLPDVPEVIRRDLQEASADGIQAFGSPQLFKQALVQMATNLKEDRAVVGRGEASVERAMLAAQTAMDRFDGALAANPPSSSRDVLLRLLVDARSNPQEIHPLRGLSLSADQLLALVRARRALRRYQEFLRADGPDLYMATAVLSRGRGKQARSGRKSGPKPDPDTLAQKAAEEAAVRASIRAEYLPALAANEPGRVSRTREEICRQHEIGKTKFYEVLAAVRVHEQAGAATQRPKRRPSTNPA